ncbi:unnamed protein product [Mycena citricolor]|uniref:Beta-galactosidase n=1 Tax=Mycena citricolor TaxID=2018698 RepID=A0AAD2JUD9_9AGAR|nr:unnamed protein product [Mycena citricolor]
MLLSQLGVLLVSALGVVDARRAPASRRVQLPRVNDGLQNLVTWDEYSLFINGTRVNLFGGEVHHYRMPVQSLHLDIFQKIKALGFNAVSTYFFWGMYEPKRGQLEFDGFRDLQPFFDAAKAAGLWIIARPGPYINAETTGGGFPGWGTHTAGLWRTENASYVEAYQGYMTAVGEKIALNQITHGGPVILVQTENEYSGFQPPYTEDFTYESDLKETLRSAGITVPLTVNDAWAGGHYTNVDIYGYDSYPNGFNCTVPDNWLADAVPEWFWGAHMQISPQSPNAVFEFQGGALDGWGGAGYDLCSQLTGPEFERVFYKNQFAMSTTMLNLYMVYGGTNWGGIAYPGVYTSYDYGSAIAEDRTLREKAYELKLQAYFRAASPAFLTTRPMNIGASQGSFTGNQALKTTQVLDVVGNKTGFYVVRQTDASVHDVQTYTLTLPTSFGNITIPALGGSLQLHGKDSKIAVVDYIAGSTTLVYSTGEVLTWATIDNRDVIILYGNAGELHETAFKTTAGKVAVVSGSGKIKTKAASDLLTVQYTTTGQTVLEIGNTLVYIVDRVNAYEFWVLHPPTSGDFAAYSTENPIIVKGGYLLRSLTTSGSTLAIKGDLNTTTTSFEIIAPAAYHSATFNGAKLSLSTTSYGTLTASLRVNLPSVSLPNLSSLNWKTADSLPEIQSSYSDALWTAADHTTTVNPTVPTTPVVLYAGDYGYHTGNLLWRAHFSATGQETGFAADVQGGSAFAYGVWLDSTFIGSWIGDGAHGDFNGTFAFPASLKQGSQHVLTILQDTMGYDENWEAAADGFKSPRGILRYSFLGSNSTAVTWKVTGNLGGESYVDKTRGPLNEGGLFGERQGWHLPGFDASKWQNQKPTAAVGHPGVAFYRATFDLHVSAGVDYPIAIVASAKSTIRAQFYVNGYQFGRYISNLGPQTTFPVPQGILNYNGENTLAVSIWALEAQGGHLDSLELQITARAQSSMEPVVNQPLTAWTKRAGAF